MYLTDTSQSIESGLYQAQNKYGSMHGRRHPAPPTSIALDDGFDAGNTEIFTELNPRERNHEYEESVTGYQNYVNEMERMLSGEMDMHAPSLISQSNLRRAASQMLGSESGRSTRALGSRRSMGGMATPNNARKVSGKRGTVELVEQKVMEDGPQRTISLWRERVAQSSGGSSRGHEDERSDMNSHVNRRLAPGAGDPRGRRLLSNTSVDMDETGTKNGMDVLPSTRASYERSEYMVTYHQPSQGDFPHASYARSEGRHSIALSPGRESSRPLPQQMTQMRKTSPTHRRRPSGLQTFERSEYAITYPQTPPRSSGSTSNPSSPLAQKIPHQRSLSPLNTRGVPLYNYDTSLDTRATSTSSVELVLASCEPSLLHIAPMLSELGIQRLEHLRAIAKLSSETRDREVKEQALMRGITVMEWAIFIDKLQSLE